MTTESFTHSLRTRWPASKCSTFSDEDASIETMSHCSGYSDPSSFAEDGKSFQFRLSMLEKRMF